MTDTDIPYWAREKIYAQRRYDRTGEFGFDSITDAARYILTLPNAAKEYDLRRIIVNRGIIPGNLEFVERTESAAAPRWIRNRIFNIHSKFRDGQFGFNNTKEAIDWFVNTFPDYKKTDIITRIDPSRKFEPGNIAVVKDTRDMYFLHLENRSTGDSKETTSRSDYLNAIKMVRAA